MSSHAMRHVCLLMGALLLWEAGELSAQDGLNAKTKTTLLRVAPAYNHGDLVTVLKTLSPLVARMKEAELEAADQFLQNQQSPPLAELLVECRLLLLQQNVTRGVPRPSARESLLLLPHLHQRIAHFQQKARAARVLADKPLQADQLEQFEPGFRELENLSREWTASLQRIDYAAKLQRSISRSRRQQASQEQQAALEVDYDQLREGALALRARLDEADVELRMRRLQRCVELLEGEQSLTGKFVAANVFDLDSVYLRQLIKEPDDVSQAVRARVGKKEFQDRLRDLEQRGSQAGGGIVEKARLLYAGIYWWERGRYGRGAAAGGLLKLKFTANSPLNQFALYIPADVPEPTDPTENTDQTPYVDRRHHFTWAYEERKVRRIPIGTSESIEYGKVGVF